jgi:DNA ligase-associated metallophosphoesterase
MRADVPQLDLCGTVFTVTPEGGLFDEASAMLIVSDLHLEKGSSFALRGRFLPPYDTPTTLGLLARAIQRFAPRQVICLGDSFHDKGGPERLGTDDRNALLTLQRGRDWVWIAGNHDPDAPVGLGGAFLPELRLGALVFRHEPARGPATGEIAGHLHPMAVVRGTGGVTRRRCVASDGARAILPAFGAYAGGLDLRDAAFAGLFNRKRFVAFALGDGRIYPVPASRCL